MNEDHLCCDQSCAVETVGSSSSETVFACTLVGTLGMVLMSLGFTKR